MIKVAIVQKDFYIGGISTACINLLNHLSKENDIELTLFTFDKIKEGLLPQNVKVVYVNSLKLFAVSNADSKNRGLFFRLRWLFVRLWCKFFTNSIPLKIALKKQRKVNEYFDLAISFSPSTGNRIFSFGSSEFVLEKLNAKTKCVMFHNDFCSSGLNNKFVVDGLSRFDKILCVSKSCAESMKNALPLITNKIDFLYNFTNEEVIKQKSNDFQVAYPDNVVNIVSVARLGEEKAHMRSLKIFKELRINYKNFIWHIVGDGKERNSLECFVRDNNMQDYIRFYGKKENPFPYIKNAYIFYLGSYHEAAPMVYAEAMLLGCPVITTNTCSAVELVPPEYGYICENSEDGIYNGLKEVLSNPKSVTEKRNNLKSFSYNNGAIVEKLIGLIK